MRIAEPMEAEDYDTENPLDLITVLPKVSFDAPRFQDIAFPPQILVRWLSGRKRRFAKALYLKRVPGVRIPPSPRLFPRITATRLDWQGDKVCQGIAVPCRRNTYADALERRKFGGIFVDLTPHSCPGLLRECVALPRVAALCKSEV